MKYTKNTRRETSLLEFTLFVGITVMMTGAVLSFSLLSTQAGMREEIIADVEYGGFFATELISRRIQAADSVRVDGSELTLIYGEDSTIITLEDDKIKIDENGDVSFLTPKSLKVSDLDFSLLGVTESNKNGVTISFKLTNSPADGTAKFFDYNRQFHIMVAGR